MSDTLINDVSDTALWVAVYRARESERSDALFHDPLAKKLAGERGEKIEASMQGTKQSEWSVVIRTCIIDDFILESIKSGIDTVINLGAGLDTRPYRMELPASLRWVEVDFPHMVQLKESKLAEEKPRCRLERIAADLSDESERKALIAKLGAETKSALVLTEGVVIYLNEENASALAKELRGQPSFRYWILDYFSPGLMPYIRSKKRLRQMKNAPFLFFPANWFKFFETRGWSLKEMRYVADVAEKLGRAMPLPWYAKIISLFVSMKNHPSRKFIGYALLEPKAV